MTPTTTIPVTIDDVRSAAEQIRGVAHRTPVLTSGAINELTGAEVFFKCENLQRVGAFKFRGAFNALSRLGDEDRARGVLTFSSGNHAQAVALSARLLGIHAAIVMPRNAPPVKLAATRGYGAEVIEFDPSEESREALAKQLGAERGLTIIPPFDHPHVIAGQGTAALELFEEVGGLDIIAAPCGGGGLLSGTSIATRAIAPGCRIIGVEPELGDDGLRSHRSGELVKIDVPDTIADGARTNSLGELTLAIIRANVDAMMTMPDDALIRAMRLVWERMKIVVEPTACLPIAALLEAGREGKIDTAGKRVGVIVSGGNVDLTKCGDWFR
ncbi:MAG: threo-3-hydroxy-L-aspartate ammonia-lyase [Phycisphaeraceae bacterium]|nr:threo-3-hydroxy-L-aspartate ammonia-lyase [Phycisphaeraceae bacterium]MCB9847510.1 threo-3-hydroxy-L-aspartate ammonia-lyase [Phycisphaeraceae bacterium]